MNRFLFVTAALFASAAFAGVHIENVTRDINTQAPQGKTQVIRVQDGMLRAENGPTSSVIVKGPTIIMIDEARKQYREMGREDMKKMADQAAAATARMQERMKNMKPEQRAMMEKMMGDRVAGGMGTPGQPDVWTSKNLGTTATVEGRRCQLWTLSRNGALFEELCVVPYDSLPGKQNYESVFKDMAEAFADVSKSVAGADQAVKARASINGYPVRIRPYEGAGKLRGTETVLVRWVEESIPASTFEIPPGFTKAQMPMPVR